ncbi:uncharacterized protein BDZ99DRAFT_117080 [Mytilinidion resinicola]|uniref:Uncharacterized protein n=1 Tax=Mytilinidion resinicola TaxID=574789 RepID=A0A6A6Y9C2_9PEZI|nr:uncharacterized protein BDZ99DRAFT_117080 [Mytilinidion resinicola]KAF2805290.1 hypothetical protein BDZ99DRAFT_117080 [Mytilinidion resinicola]
MSGIHDLPLDLASNVVASCVQYEFTPFERIPKLSEQSKKSIFAFRALSRPFCSESRESFAKIIEEKEFFFTRDSLEELANVSKDPELQPWIRVLSLNGARFKQWSDETKLAKRQNWMCSDARFEHIRETTSPLRKELIKCQEDQQLFWDSGDLEKTLTEIFTRLPKLREIRLSPSAVHRHIPGWNGKEHAQALKLFERYWGRHWVEEEQLYETAQTLDNAPLLNIFFTAVVRAGVQLETLVIPFKEPQSVEDTPDLTYVRNGITDHELANVSDDLARDALQHVKKLQLTVLRENPQPLQPGIPSQLDRVVAAATRLEVLEIFFAGYNRFFGEIFDELVSLASIDLPHLQDLRLASSGDKSFAPEALISLLRQHKGIRKLGLAGSLGTWIELFQFLETELQLEELRLIAGPTWPMSLGESQEFHAAAERVRLVSDPQPGDADYRNGTARHYTFAVFEGLDQ